MRYFLYALIPLFLSAQERGIKLSQSAGPEKRIALVIGNAKYSSSPLRNPENDAIDMAKVLSNANFVVDAYTNLNQKEMKRAIRRFGEQLNSNCVALFYYAGHAAQVSGKNYLIPIDADIVKEEDVELESVDVARVLAEMEAARSRLNIVVLDACRDSPLPRTFRSTARGLAQMTAPVGTLIAYSTSPGSIASDGSGRNGLYTGKLLKYLGERGLRLEDVFKNVRTEVREESGGAQITWESNSIEGDFYFHDAIATIIPPAPKEPLPSSEKTQANKEFSLDDIESERVAGNRKLQAMKDAFEKVQDLLKDTTVSNSKKDLARQRFLGFFAEDLTWTNEDDAMRKLVSKNLDINFILVEGGTFQMGDIDGTSDAKPVHKVALKSFSVSATEITFEQYDSYCYAIGKEKPDDNGWGRSNRPVINMNWEDANGFCKWTSGITGTTIRLPYEAEWEYTARGGKKTHGNRFSGSNSIESVGWYKRNAGSQTHGVETKQPNELGIYDMTGNVWEWCQDYADPNYYRTSPSDNPHGPSTGNYRVLRGGGWINSDSYCTVGTRNGNSPDVRNQYCGFRVVQELQ